MADENRPPIEPDDGFEDVPALTTPPGPIADFARRDLPPRPPHPGFFFATLWCVVFLVVTQFVPGIFGVVYGFVSVMSESAPEARDDGDPLDPPDLEEVVRRSLLPAMILAQVLSIAFSLLVLRLVIGPDWAREVALRAPSIEHVLLTLLMFPAVVLLANGSYALLKEVLPSLSDLLGIKGMPGMEDMVREFGAWPLPVAILIVGVGPGLGEELWCRAFLGRGLVGHYGVTAGVVLTSILFGAIHVDPRQGTMAALMGVVLHFVYLTSRSLWLPILLHFLNNSLAMIGVKVGGELAKLDQAPEQIPVILYYTAGGLLFAVAWALYQSRARLAEKSEIGWPWRPSFPSVAHPPKDSATVIYHPRVGFVPWFAVAVTAVAFTCVLILVLRG